MPVSSLCRRGPVAPACAVSLGLFIGVAGAAASETDTLSVSALVPSRCQLDGGTLNFGTYVSGQSEPLEATGAIGYRDCYGTLTFELDGGQSGNVQARAMRSGDDSLTYQLYQDNARTTLWGQGGNALQIELATPESGEVQVHGRIPGGQIVPGGTYTDTVNITLSF